MKAQMLSLVSFKLAVSTMTRSLSHLEHLYLGMNQEVARSLLASLTLPLARWEKKGMSSPHRHQINRDHSFLPYKGMNLGQSLLPSQAEWPMQ